jgi:hypothetical protein
VRGAEDSDGAGACAGVPPSGGEVDGGAAGLLFVASGLPAFLFGSEERGTDAARAGADEVIKGVTAFNAVASDEAAFAGGGGVGAVARIAALLVSSGERLAATLTVDAAIDVAVAVMLLVLATSEGLDVVTGEAIGVVVGLVVAGVLWALRVNQNAPTQIATAASPISVQGVRDLFFRAEGGNCNGADSSGIVLKLRAALV